MACLFIQYHLMAYQRMADEKNEMFSEYCLHIVINFKYAHIFSMLSFDFNSIWFSIIFHFFLSLSLPLSLASLSRVCSESSAERVLRWNYLMSIPLLLITARLCFHCPFTFFSSLLVSSRQMRYSSSA